MKYCTKCGKYIDYDATICNECKQAEEQAKKEVAQDFGFEQSEFTNTNYSNSYSNSTTFTNDTVNATPVPAQQGSIMTGFGKALTAVILATVASLFLSFLTEFTDVDVAYILAAFTIGLSIPSLILGIQSIKCFLREKAKGNNQEAKETNADSKKTKTNKENKDEEEN